MPLFLLDLAILVGLYGLYRFLLAANVRQVMALFLSAALVAVVAAMFFLAMTGRLSSALVLLVALWPAVAGVMKRYKRAQQRPVIDAEYEVIPPEKDAEKKDEDAGDK
jgi:hypothetical protein